MLTRQSDRHGVIASPHGDAEHGIPTDLRKASWKAALHLIDPHDVRGSIGSLTAIRNRRELSHLPPLGNGTRCRRLHHTNGGDGVRQRASWKSKSTRPLIVHRPNCWATPKARKHVIPTNANVPLPPFGRYFLLRKL